MKGKEPQSKSPAVADFALPLQINIQFLGGRVESLERRLPIIEETIRMLSNLLSTRGAIGSVGSVKDPTIPFQFSSSSAFHIPTQATSQDPGALELSFVEALRQKSNNFPGGNEATL